MILCCDLEFKIIILNTLFYQLFFKSLYFFFNDRLAYRLVNPPLGGMEQHIQPVKFGSVAGWAKIDETIPFCHSITNPLILKKKLCILINILGYVKLHSLF